MSDAPKRNPVARVLMGVLGFQLVLGGLLFVGDLQNGFSLPRLGPKSPNLSEPVRPGDQTRRFSPSRSVPNSGEPLPERLTLTVVSGGAGILLEGEIAGGDAPRILKQIEELPTPPTRAILNSPGGSVQDALELGRALRLAGLETEMRDGDICYSACPYLLAAGTKRSVPETAFVGVHQHYFGENTLLPAFVAVEDIQRGQGLVMRYLDEMGIDPLVMQHALVTPPDDIYVLLPEELVRYKFIAALPQ
ncbi:COG3904 family protein [Sulfitobacter guttiformis]|uniref:Periplasmic protein n=1 Tax=Sulfitobacter guttiformis TaxID=74349 RepID=A0A420DNQ8_9RHOB|nr:hypothetical protein [Sulfitobacter guttiformis]KIN73158.1 Periplasmic protein-like protein [Sulfitobacter guttiformis KCTC 32187]RKE95840.1 hypothetical protein C8N30_0383 [Sulfitobacter guttiformis]